MIRQLIIIWIAVALVWFALNVPAEQVNIESTFAMGTMEQTKRLSLEKKGGFPWTYCEFAIPSPADPNAKLIYRQWSSLNLCWNVSVGISFALAIGGVVLISHRRWSESPHKHAGKATISLAAMLWCTTILAAGLGFYRYSQQRIEDRIQLFRHVGSRAVAKLTVPKWLAEYWDLGFLQRIQSATVNGDQLSESERRQISRMPHLERLYLSNADSTTICKLLHLPKLQLLSVDRCVFDDAVCEAIIQAKQLRRVRFKFYDTLPDNSLLRRAFAELERRSGSGEIELISSSPPSVVVDGISALDYFALGNPAVVTNLKVTEASSQSATSVVLRNLPHLRNVGIVGLLHRLEIEHAPQIRQLSLDHGIVEQLTLHNLPALTELQLGVVHPRSISLQDLPSLGSRTERSPTGVRFQLSPSRSFSRSGIHLRIRITAEVVRSLGEFAGSVVLQNEITLAGLAEMLPKLNSKVLNLSSCRFVEGHEHADIDSLPVIPTITEFHAPWRDRSTPDLYQLLAKMPNLKKLWAGALTDEEVPLLASLNQLEELDLSWSAVTDKGWRQLPHLPNLTKLVTPRSLTQIELGNLDKLRDLETGLERFRTIRLENLPAFDASVDISWDATDVLLRNLGRVKYLRIDRLPRSLEVYNTPIVGLSVADSAFGDSDLARLVCAETEHLSVPNTGVSSASLDLILSLKKLRRLDISGTEMGEADVKRMLAELELDELRAAQIELSHETEDALPRTSDGLRIRSPRYSP